MEEKEIGVVKKWIAERGFGFIKPDSGAPDCFVHVRAFHAAGLPEPSEGTRLRYAIEHRDGRLRAAELEAVQEGQ